jgi:thioredoxin-like negative regulator of GroEL
VGPTGTPLVVVFASATCNSCPVVWEEVVSLGNEGLSIERIDVQDDPKRHERYRIDGVPTTLVADGEGVVRASFFGPLPVGALAEAVGTVLDDSRPD